MNSQNIKTQSKDLSKVCPWGHKIAGPLSILTTKRHIDKHILTARVE